jgi:hypothetical protein
MISTTLQSLPSPHAFADEFVKPRANRTPYGGRECEVDDAAEQLNYMEVTPLKLLVCPEDIKVVEINAYTQSWLYELAVQTRGEVWAIAEELDSIDCNLPEPDAEYQQMGLCHYRRAWLALDPDSGRSLGALISCRSPAGSIFGLLENRADLLVSEQVEDERLEDVVTQLISVAAETYDDFPPGFIPLVADNRAARVLWLRGDQHVDDFFGEHDVLAQVVPDNMRHF